MKMLVVLETVKEICASSVMALEGAKQYVDKLCVCNSSEGCCFLMRAIKFVQGSMACRWRLFALQWQ